MDVCQSCVWLHKTDFRNYKRDGYNFGFSDMYW